MIKKIITIIGLIAITIAILGFTSWIVSTSTAATKNVFREQWPYENYTVLEKLQYAKWGTDQFVIQTDRGLKFVSPYDYNGFEINQTYICDLWSVMNAESIGDTIGLNKVNGTLSLKYCNKIN